MPATFCRARFPGRVPRGDGALPAFLLGPRGWSPPSSPHPSSAIRDGRRPEPPQGHVAGRGSPGAPGRVLAGCLRTGEGTRDGRARGHSLRSLFPKGRKRPPAPTLLKCCWRDPTPARERCKAERLDLLTHFVARRPTRIRRLTLQQRGDSENQWALLQTRRVRARAATAAHPSKGTPKHPRGEAPAQHPTPEANWAAWPATALHSGNE